jgi:hypothetical protein
MQLAANAAPTTIHIVPIIRDLLKRPAAKRGADAGILTGAE